MTKGEYCHLNGFHFCNPSFDVKSEADEEWKNEMDKFFEMLREDFEEKVSAGCTIL